MVNLFQQIPAGPGRLTAALLALLEHGDRKLLRGLLERAGIKAKVGAKDGVQAVFPAPGGPPGAGLLALPGRPLTVVTQAPGEPWDPTPLTTPADTGAMSEPPAAPDRTVLAITLTGRPPEGVHHLSWEQVDRWLADQAEAYDPEGRTGFLIEQFRTLLAESGIEYFAGFEPEAVAQAPDALTALTAFYQTADRFFERVGPALAALREGIAQVRESRPEDLLAGYCYRDYAGAPLGPESFLRVALHLPRAELQVSCWLLPESQGRAGAQARLREALQEEDGLLSQLRALRERPLLWLWSPDEERHLPLDELEPAAVPDLPWAGRYAAIQRSLPFDGLTREGLIETVATMAEELLDALLPVTTGLIH